MTTAVGIDIGGTGIKGAVVDTVTGKLLSDRVKLPTPTGGEPNDIVATVLEIVKTLDVDASVPVGVCFPAIASSMVGDRLAGQLVAVSASVISDCRTASSGFAGEPASVGSGVAEGV